MPYGISANQSDCNDWAAVKKEADGSLTTLACYPTKQEAIDRMVAQSLAEGMEPAGDLGASRSISKRNEEMVTLIDSAIGLLMQAKQSYEVDEMEEEEEEIEEPEETEEPEEASSVEFRQVSLSAPAFMRASARRGIALHEEGLSGDGLKPQTVEDARRMAAGDVTEEKWRKIGPWIARHIVDLEAVGEGEVTPGLVAMLLWGGGSTKASARRAQEYAERLVERLDAEE
jgi:hypothetical protein